MSFRRIRSPLALSFLVLAIPLLTGASGKGCGGGDVVIGGDGGGTGGTTGSGNVCSVDADCETTDLSCLICDDGTCGTPGCVDGSCGFVCPEPPGGECSAAADCPAIEICQVCSDGSCAAIDCVDSTCGFVCPEVDRSCAGNELFLEVKGDGADQTYTFANCYTDTPPSGPVEAYLVHHVGAPTGLAIRSCSGEVAWITLYGESGDVLPGVLGNATTDYVAPSGAEYGAKDTAVSITFFGEVGEVVEGTFTSHLDVGPETAITLTGSFRACRAPNAQDP